MSPDAGKQHVDGSFQGAPGITPAPTETHPTQTAEVMNGSLQYKGITLVL